MPVSSPKLDPVRPPTKGTGRASMLSVFIAVNLMLAGWLLISSLLPRAAPAADGAAAAPPNGCADAVERVQAYQAPGQSEPLTEAIAANVAAEGVRRPVAVVGWEPPRAWRGDCEVWDYSSPLGTS